MSERASVLAPFRHETFRLLWLATLVSNLGGLVQSVGAGWMMTTLTDSHNMVALVQASTTLPIMVFSIAAGALADNFDRRIVMLIAQGGLMVVSLALAVLAFMGLLNPWLLLSLHLPDRLRHGAVQPVLAGLDGRHRAAQRPAGRGDAQLHGLQHDAQRRPGGRRPDRRAAPGRRRPLRSTRFPTFR